MGDDECDLLGESPGNYRGTVERWVYRSLIATPKIEKKMKSITTPTLLFQAELDQVVMPRGENNGCAATSACTLLVVKGSQHEILMEKDSIRNAALTAIRTFFQ